MSHGGGPALLSLSGDDSMQLKSVFICPTITGDKESQLVINLIFITSSSVLSLSPLDFLLQAKSNQLLWCLVFPDPQGYLQIPFESSQN